MSLKNNDSNKMNKLGKKDIMIVVLSIIMFILLITIVIVSKQRDQMISQSLQNNSDFSTDDAIANINSASINYLEITEVSSKNWIEIHNLSSEPVDISGLQIKIADKIEKQLDEGITINKDGYYVIELESNPGAKENNIITIIDANGNAIKSIIIPMLNGEDSYGIADSEKNIWAYMEESKGKKNTSKNMRYLQMGGIYMSAPGGFYDSSFQLQLNCNDGEKIYYTTDGTKPTKDSILYEDPITINNNSGFNHVYSREALYDRLYSGYIPGTVDAGTIVWAIKIDNAGNTIGEMSQTYFVGLSRDSDYLNLPVISITTDPENLFDYENGIYVAGKQREDAIIQGLEGAYYANYYNYWPKPIKIEYYEPTKDKTFYKDATITIYNDIDMAARQKGFEISLGDNSDSEFIGSTIARFISSDGKIRLTTNYEDNDLKVRNLLADAMTEGTDIAGTGCSPCVVFLEGEYWGLYMLRPYYDEKYIEQKYGLKDQDILIYSKENYVDEYHYLMSFADQNDLSIQQNYEQISTMMDIDNFIDYICINIFLGNSSFRPQFGTAWRTASSTGQGFADGRWRFIVDDMSNTMYLSSLQTPTIDSYLQWGVQSDILFQSLLQNDGFCEKLKSRMEELVLNYFNYEISSEKLDSIVDLIKKPALASNIRFTASLSDGQYSSKIQDIEAFLEERPEYIIKYTEKLAQKGGDVQKARELLAHKDSNSDDTLDEQSETEVEESENSVDTDNNTEETGEIEETEENING